MSESLPDLEALRAQQAQAPDAPGPRLALARGLNNAAVRQHLMQGQHAQAIALLEEAQRLIRPLQQAQPDDAELGELLVMLLDHAGQSHAALGQLEPVRAAYAELLALWRRRAEREASLESQWRLASWLGTAGSRFWPLGALAEARSHFEEAHALAQQLAQAHPGQPDAERSLSVATGHLRQLAEVEGKPQEILRWDDAALALRRREVERHPDDPGARSSLCSQLGAAAARAVSQGLLGRGQHLVEEQLASAAEAVRRWPQEPWALSEQAEALKNHAGIAQQSGDVAACRARFDQHVAALRALVAREASSVNLERLSSALGDQADLVPEGDDAALAPVLESWLAAIRQRLPVTPFPTEARMELAKALGQRAALHQRQGQSQEAWSRYEEALGVQVEVVRERRQDPLQLVALAILIWNSHHLLPDPLQVTQLRFLLEVLQPLREGAYPQADQLRQLANQALHKLPGA